MRGGFICELESWGGKKGSGLDLPATGGKRMAMRARKRSAQDMVVS